MVRIFENTGYWTIILGGSTGLGLASAKRLASAGMNICIVHRTPRNELDHLAFEFDHIKSLGVKFIDYNVDACNAERQQSTISQINEHFSKGEKVRCLLHSIAKGNLKSIMDGDNRLVADDLEITIKAMSISLYEWAIKIHTAGLFSSDARILSFTSEGSSKSIPHYAAVSAAKAALEAITRSLAVELAKYGIRSNCIQAGVTDTNSLRKIPNNNEIISFTKMRNPFKRLTTPEDVANVVYLLCTDEASWINGAIIPADGGERIT